jgi:hypothetical protein
MSHSFIVIASNFSNTVVIVIVETYIVTDTFVPTYVPILLYYSSRTHVIMQLVDATTAAAGKVFMTDATIIGLVCGAAAILAILVGGAIFIVKKSGRSMTLASGSDPSGMATMVTPGALDITEIETTDGLSLTSGGDPGSNFTSLAIDRFTPDQSEGAEAGVFIESDHREMWV